MFRLVLTAAFVVLCIVMIGGLIGLAGRTANRRDPAKGEGKPGGGDGPSEG